MLSTFDFQRILNIYNSFFLFPSSLLFFLLLSLFSSLPPSPPFLPCSGLLQPPPAYKDCTRASCLCVSNKHSQSSDSQSSAQLHGVTFVEQEPSVSRSFSVFGFARAQNMRWNRLGSAVATRILRTRESEYRKKLLARACTR